MPFHSHLLAVTLTNQLNKWSQIVQPGCRMKAPFIPRVSSIKESTPGPSSVSKAEEPGHLLPLPLSSLSSVALQESHWIHKGLREHFHQCTRRLHCISPRLRLIPSPLPSRTFPTRLWNSSLCSYWPDVCHPCITVLNIYASFGKGLAIVPSLDGWFQCISSTWYRIIKSNEFTYVYIYHKA